MVDVEQWAEMRRMHFVGGVSIKEIARLTGRDRAVILIRALYSRRRPDCRRRRCAASRHARGPSKYGCWGLPSRDVRRLLEDRERVVDSLVDRMRIARVSDIDKLRQALLLAGT